MAVIISSMPLLSNTNIHHKPKPTPSTSNRVRVVFMLAQKGSYTQNGSSPPIQNRSEIKIQKVFEDKSSGIVCYKDEKGEIICEGYDEGPRLDHDQHWFSRFSCYQRNGEAIVRGLKRSLLLVIDGASKVK